MQYIDITASTTFAGFVGLISPFLFPFLFKFIGKLAQKELTVQEKRLVITLVAFLVSIGIVAYHFEWYGAFLERAWAFMMYLALNFVTIKGVVQSVYETIIKTFPVLDEKLEKVAEYKK